MTREWVGVAVEPARGLTYEVDLEFVDHPRSLRPR